MKITFVNELSKDAGGLSREFFNTLMKELLSSNLGLFLVANTPEFSYKINEDSKHIDNCHTMFYFFGKVLAKALFDNIPINVCLNKSIFKALVGEDKEQHYADLEEIKNIDYNVRCHLQLSFPI
jgi:E3 ubiquitin-protein ligase HUWE1